MSQAVTKVCRFCETDVSGLPRIKDNKGRYACQPCFERLKAKRIPEPKANPYAFDPDVDTDAITLDVTESSAVTGQQPMMPCPSCKSMMGASDVFCIQCGTNVQTGGKLGKVKVQKAKPQKVRSRRAHAGSDDCGPGTAIFSIVLVATIAAGLLLTRPLGLPPVVLGISIMLFVGYIGATAILTLFASWRQDGFVQFLLVFFVPFYILYWVYARAESALLKLNVTLALILYFGVLVILLAFGTP